MLQRAGWRVRFTADADRARIEALYSDGAAVMLTAVRGRGINAYVLHAAVRRPPRWLGIALTHLDHFAEHRQLPHTARRWELTSKCRCGKRGRFPTEAWAKKILTDIKIRKELRLMQHASERRVYRCPDDDRRWHITSSKKWYGSRIEASR
ncbi:hypothetical protein ACIQRE_01740 [Streptomyces griseoluteus]|uniref:hypothetical protein n=1 Tax=Streptomyces griseoluteus TaxID=29306 RepID=UPI00380544B9